MKIEFDEATAQTQRVAGYERRCEPRSILALGVRQGQLWVLEMEKRTLSGLPVQDRERAVSIGLALSVLWLSLQSILEQSTSALRALWCRSDGRIHPPKGHQ